MSENFCNHEAEVATLGAILLDSRALSAVEQYLCADSFYDTKHRKIYQSILKLSKADKPIDLITLTEELRGSGSLDACNGSAYISALTDAIPTAANVKYYAGIVRDQARKRELLNVIDRTKKALNGPQLPTELLKELAIKAGDLNNGKKSSNVFLQCLADVKPVSLRWLWAGRIPAGKLTLLVGDPGLGKSVITLDLATRVSMGASWPDDHSQGTEPGDVLILSAEDDPADTIVPRLIAVGADLKRIFILKGVKRGDKIKHFSLADDLAALEDVLTSETRLIIIDPISAYLGEDTDSHKNTSVRAVLAPLADLAARTGAAVLGVSHLNKGQGSAIYRVQGSIGFTAAARAVWAVGKEPGDETGKRRLLLPIKCNLAADAEGLRYGIEEYQKQPTVHWGAAVSVDAADVLSREPKEELSGRQAAEAFLQELLEDGPVEANDVRKAAKANCIAPRTLSRAKEILHIISEKTGYESGWQWRLPDTKAAKSPEECQECHPGNVGTLRQDWHSSEKQETLITEYEGATGE